MRPLVLVHVLVGHQGRLPGETLRAKATLERLQIDGGVKVHSMVAERILTPKVTTKKSKI